MPAAIISDRKASLYESCSQPEDEKAIFEGLLGVSLSSEQLNLLDMPQNVRDILIRFKNNQNDEKALSKKEIKVLRDFGKKKIKEMKKLKKEKAKEKKELLRFQKRNTHKTENYTDLITPPLSDDEKQSNLIDENDKKEIDYQRSFFSQDATDNSTDYELVSKHERIANDEDEKLKAERALAMKEEMMKIETLQEEADAIETMMGDNIVTALENREQARGIASKTEGMKWRSKEFRKKTNGFLRNLTIKKVLKGFAIGLAIMVVMMIVIGIVMSMMMLFVL